MGTDENIDVTTHRLTVLGVDEICIFAVDMEEVLEHTEDKARNGKYLGKGMESELTGDCNEE